MDLISKSWEYHGRIMGISMRMTPLTGFVPFKIKGKQRGAHHWYRPFLWFLHGNERTSQNHQQCPNTYHEWAGFQLSPNGSPNGIGLWHRGWKIARPTVTRWAHFSPHVLRNRRKKVHTLNRNWTWQEIGHEKINYQLAMDSKC